MLDRGKRSKPVVLLVGEDGFDIGIGGAHYVINKSYAMCFEQVGMIPLLAYDIRNIKEYVAFADILCLTGGANIHPAWYQEYYRDSTEMEGLSQSRDDLDFALCQRFVEEGKPILAIGRGMQVVNVALGGTLCRDIEKKTRQNHWNPHCKHPIYKIKDNLLSEFCGDSLLVNSYHHQGIALLGDGLIAAYQAEDGLIEAFFHHKLPILGVQWHPEQEDWDGKQQIEVFAAFRKWIGLQDKKRKLWYEEERKKPIILVNGGPAFDRQFQGSSWVANKTYSSAVSAAGGVPFMPLTEQATEDYACFADGLILTGSISFAPEKGLEKQVQQEELPKRERLDQELFWSFYRKKKPILGICLGHQMINCYLGGTLEGRFKFRTGVEHMMHQHLVLARKDSILFSLFGEFFWVNSRHNDKIDKIAKELQVTAWSEDGVIEAFEHTTLPIYGVEWHPERMRGDFREPPEGPDMTKLFEWFIQNKK